MRSYDIIYKKRTKGKLTEEEIHHMITGYVAGEIPDYQMAAFLMASFIQGLDEEETFYLTMEMLHSGEHMDLSAIPGVKVDKHSTGGVGDKTTLTLAPLVASFGIPMAKMSGRGLGHTGGTVDKLEAIPGFRTEISEEEFIEQVKSHGVAVVGQTKNLVPADKLIYALRDVTATVDHPSLIASSIMSKKLASGSNAILLDVKVGSGAFIKTEEEAIYLAKIMVSLGERAGRTTRAMITSMDQHLGFVIGNANEVEEAMETLKGRGPEDLRLLTLTLCAQLLLMEGSFDDFDQATEAAALHIDDGKAFAKFEEFVTAQGGTSLELPKPEYSAVVLAPQSGYVSEFVTQGIGEAAALLGAGRRTKEESIDLSAGIYLPIKLGDYVEEGQVIARLESTRVQDFREAEEKLLSSINITPEQRDIPPLIRALVFEEEGEIKVETWS